VANKKYEFNEAVMSAIHDERVFQNRKWGTVEEHPHEVGAWLTIMRKLLTDAEAAWAGSSGDAGALDEIRKVVATGMACMEQHGVIPRSPLSFIALQGGHVSHSVEGE
jgi:hypothetical protein